MAYGLGRLKFSAILLGKAPVLPIDLRYWPNTHKVLGSIHLRSHTVQGALKVWLLCFPGFAPTAQSRNRIKNKVSIMQFLKLICQASVGLFRQVGLFPHVLAVALK